jgi:hypothetical protein
MGVSTGYKKEIIDITKELRDDKLKSLIDFAQFLKAKGGLLIRKWRIARNMSEN